MSTDFTGNAAQDIAQSTFFQPVNVANLYLNVTSSQVIKGGPGFLAGIFVNSSTSGTLKFYDNATAASGAVICNTFTPSLGWNPCPIHFLQGLYATVGGTLDCTFCFS